MPKLKHNRNDSLFGDNWQEQIQDYDAQAVQGYLTEWNSELEQLRQADQAALGEEASATSRRLNQVNRVTRQKFNDDDLAARVLKLTNQGYAPVRVANALGLSNEQVNQILGAAPELRTRERFAGQAYQAGASLTQMAAALGVSEREAGLIYARGHNPRQPFPADLFPQPSFKSETNRQSQAIQKTLQAIEAKFKPLGYGQQVTFEADTFGGAYTVQLIAPDGQNAGQPFRLSATPGDVPLVNKTGKGPGGFRKTQVGLNANPLPFDQAVLKAVVQMANNAKSGDQARQKQVNVVDLLDVNSVARNPTTHELIQPEGAWRNLSWDFMTMSRAGQYREEHAETMQPAKFGQTDYPENLPYAPMVYGGTSYPINARNYISGNIRSPEGLQYTSQQGIGKMVKRDNLSLTRKYWQIGPAPGVAYPTQKQHILGQLATEPEEVTPATALVLSTGGLIPEGEMWLDRGFAPWSWLSFEQNPKKYQLRIGDRGEEEVLRSLGLWDEQAGGFKSRTLHPGQTLKMAGSDQPRDFIGKNERSVITGYDISEMPDEEGAVKRILQLQGYVANRTNSTSAFKFQEEKHLALTKDIRGRMGLDVDIVKNKPSGAAAMIGVLSAMPREQLEALWERSHGHRNVTLRTSTQDDLKAMAKAYGRLFSENYQGRIILPNQDMDLSTLMKYWRAGRIEDPTRIKTRAPFFEGGEPMFRTDVQAAGSVLPVGLKMVTDVTDLEEGKLSHDILRWQDRVHPGLGTEMRQRGEPRREIYDTLFEIGMLNADPTYARVATPVADLFHDLADPEMRQQVRALQSEILAGSMPEYLAKAVMGHKHLSAKQKTIYDTYTTQSRSQALEAYYADRLGTDMFALYAGHKPYIQAKQGGGMAAFMLNPGATERFGFIGEETNQLHSKLASAGREVLGQAWSYLELMDRGNASRTEAYDAISQATMQMMSFTDQEKLLLAKGSRKKWFGTSDDSIFTHVHASDPSIPRNAMATSWRKISDMLGLDTQTEEGRRLANEASRRGELRSGGFRNPASDPMAQLAQVRNVITPDLARELGLDLDLSNDALIFHPEAIMGQGGDNDSDESQVYGLTRFTPGGRPVNRYDLTAPSKVTEAAIGHSAGEYKDALKKLNASEADTIKDILGFDPRESELKMLGREFPESQISRATKTAHQLKSVQIGQAYNFPLKAALNLSPHLEAQQLISQYAGHIYQHPLDAKVYEPGSPEHQLFGFFNSWNPVLGQYKLSQAGDQKPAYRSYKQKEFEPVYGSDYNFAESRGIFGAEGLLRVLSGMMKPGLPGEVRAPIDPEQAAALITGSLESEEQNRAGRAYVAGLLRENPAAILDPRFVKHFAGGDSPLAQMLRGYGAHNALNAAPKYARDVGYFQKALAEGNPDYDGERLLQNKTRAQAKSMQDYMQRGGGSSSPELAQAWSKFLNDAGLKPSDNLFRYFDSKEGDFNQLPVEQRSHFYQGLSDFMQLALTPEHSGIAPLMGDYQRLRDYMGPAAEENDWEPRSVAELAASESVGDIVGEKWRNRHHQTVKTINRGQRKGQPLQQMLFDEEEAVKYMAEGGVLDRPTKLGQTRNGREVIGGKAGREYVVPEGKTHDLGGGLKLFDEDELGKGAPHPFGYSQGSQGERMMLAKGGILDYQAYANAPTGRFEDAIRQVAYELTGGRFSGDSTPEGLKAVTNLLRQHFDADIRRMGDNPPANGQPGLMASSMSGRITEMMALALGPNPAPADFAKWNDLLGEYGLSADLQPLGVNPQQIDPAIKKLLLQEAGGDSQAYKAALSSHMQQLNSQLAGKSFSHANYGNVYNAIPGWQDYWNGNRPASTMPTIAPSEMAQANLNRLLGGAGDSGGGAGQPPQGAGAPAGGDAGELKGKELTSYAQPFSPQTVEMYKTLAEKLGKYADTIEELNLKGGTLAEASGEAAQVIRAAGKTYHRVEGQYSRAQRVLRYDQLQNKFDAFQYREGQPLTDEESREFSQLQEQMTKPTGADVSAAGQVRRYIQDIFPVYAEREAAGRKGTRLPRQMIANSPLAWAAQIAGRDPSLVKEDRAAERQGLRLGQLDRKLGDIQDWYTATREGESQAFGAGHPVLADAAEVKYLSNLRQSRYEQAVPLKQQYEEAKEQGDLGRAQRLFDELHPLSTEIGDLKDQIGALTPHVKEHIDALKIQTTSIREEIKERKATYSALTAKYDELQREKVDLTGPPRLSKAGEIGAVRSEMDATAAEIKERAKTLGQKEFEKQTLSDLIHEPQGRAITGLGSRPQTYGQQALGELAKGYEPQRLFWQFQNMQQLQYMAFMPMLQMRGQYLGEQAALGQANYALGAGGMPESVLSALSSQANMSRAQSTFGRGVDKSIAMNAWKGFTGFLGQNEGAGSFLGSLGFDLTSGLTAAMGLKMLGGPAVSALGKLAGGLGVKSAPYLSPAGAPSVLASTGAAALTGGGVVAGGLGVGLGLGVNELLAHAFPQTGAQPLSKHLTVGAYELGGLGFRPEDMATLGGSFLGRKLGGEKLWDQDRANAWGKGVGEYTGAVTEPIPVWVTKMESEVAKQLGVSPDNLPFDRTELAQMVQMYAETQGITKKQIEESPDVAEGIGRDIAQSITSGVSTPQQLSIRQKAVDVSGYAPGTTGATMMTQWINQGSLYEQQQRLQAGGMVQNLADQMDFTPQQRQQMSQKVYDLLSEGVSQNQVARSLQQRGMSNQYYWSAAAYAAGQPELAMMDQDRPWQPKYQTQMWAIEDRRRVEDNTRELGLNGSTWSGGRQEQELGWQRQKLDLEEKFWDFRRKSQLEDFDIQQKLFDFNIKQQRQAMDWEERQSRTQTNYYERQYSLNKQIFDLQSDWQRQDFDKQEGRLDTQRAWQVQDFAWNRDSFELQTGWQQEDLERSLRYSNGRQRLDIRRQMERAGILADRKRTELGREEDRAEVKYDWAKDDLAESRARFEEMNALQREQMELGRTYWQEQQSLANDYRGQRKAMMEEQIGLQQEQNALNVAQFQEQMRLADEQHQLERGIAEQKYQWGLQDLELARQRSAEDQKILGWQRETATASQTFQMYQQLGYEAAVKAVPEIEKMATAAGTLADNMERAYMAMDGGAALPSGIPGANGTEAAPNSSAAMFAGGGYTGDGAPGEVAGIVHRGEYVVPQNGALVISGQSQSDDRLANLLESILGQLQGGGKLVLDVDELKKSGFIHIEDLEQVYR